MDVTVGGYRLTATRTGGLIEGRSYGDVAEGRQRFSGCPQAGRLNAVIVGEEDLK
jgi:hypothetical protein